MGRSIGIRQGEDLGRTITLKTDISKGLRNGCGGCVTKAHGLAIAVGPVNMANQWAVVAEGVFNGSFLDIHVEKVCENFAACDFAGA